MTRVDVVVVGAGPAGSATAALLAQRGADVLLLDRARFPRPKPCAEYLSPEAGRVLDRLGVLADLDAEAPARLRGMRVVSPDGTSFLGRFGPTRGFRPFRPYGLALPRARLDARLAAAAVRAGARFHEGTTLETIDVADDGVRIVTRSGTVRNGVRARFLVGADGLHSRVARRFGLARIGARRRFALVAHARGVAGVGGVGEMHVGRGAYVGLAAVGRGITNVAVVADAATFSRAGNRERVFRDVLGGFPALRVRLAGAEWIDTIRAVGPFARWTTRAHAPRTLLVGDAADFYDPFTGEGVFAALRGAELADARIADALAAGGCGTRALAGYDRDRRRAFGAKWLVERLIARAVAMPRAFDRLARRLARRSDLADLVVGVTGDFVPASQILRPSFIWSLIG